MARVRRTAKSSQSEPQAEAKKVIRKFDSIADFEHYLDVTPASTLFRESRHVLYSKEGSRYFTGTSSYEEATELLNKGDKKAYNALKGAKEAFSAASNAGTVQRRQVQRSIAGFMPNVPASLMNLPQSMFAVRTAKVASRVLNVLYLPTASGIITTEELLSAGNKVAKAVYTTEAKGVRVNLWIGIATRTEKQSLTLVVNIKKADQYGNLLKTAYPLTHPSFLRRQGFRAIEVEEGLTDKNFINGYGRPKHLNDVMEDLSDMKFDVALDFKSIKDMSQDEVNDKFSK